MKVGSSSPFDGSENNIQQLMAGFDALAISNKSHILKCTDAMATLIQEIGRDYHGLTNEECKSIAARAVMLLTNNEMVYLPENPEKKGKSTACRTIYYDFHQKKAYVFLKTKGGLTASEGHYRRGTRALRLELNGTHLTVDTVFQLVSRDCRATSSTALRRPFSRLKKKLTSEQCKELAPILQEPYVFFRYTKRLSNGERVKKSCAFYPVRSTLTDMLNKHPNTNYVIVCLYTLLKKLQVLHRLDVGHGDIKGANILIERGVPHFADFDRAYVKAPRRSDEYGTLEFSAPELLKGEGTRMPLQADIYALACTFWRCFGSLSFRALLKQYRAEGRQNQELLSKAIAEQEMLKKLAIKAKEKTLKQIDLSDEEFLEAILFCMLHPEPQSRITADVAVAEFDKRYTFNIPN